MAMASTELEGAGAIDYLSWWKWHFAILVNLGHMIML